MLLVAEEHLQSHNKDARLVMFGQEIRCFLKQKDSSHERESMIRELKLDSMVEFSVRLVTLNFTIAWTSLRR